MIDGDKFEIREGDESRFKGALEIGKSSGKLWRVDFKHEQGDAARKTWLGVMRVQDAGIEARIRDDPSGIPSITEVSGGVWTPASEPGPPRGRRQVERGVFQRVDGLDQPVERNEIAHLAYSAPRIRNDHVGSSPCVPVRFLSPPGSPGTPKASRTRDVPVRFQVPGKPALPRPE